MRFCACTVVVCVFALSCSSDDANADRTTTARRVPTESTPGPGDLPAEAPPAPLPRLTEAMATPYFRAGVARQAAGAFAREHWAEARAGFAAHLGDEASVVTDEDRARVRLLIALCDGQLGRWADAAAGFELAAERLPLLADFLHYHAARALYFAHEHDRARAHADQVARDSRMRPDTDLLVGDLLRAGGKWQDMVAHYTGYLGDRRDGLRFAEARFRLAEALEQTGRAVPDALELYRRIDILAPLSPWAERAKERFDVLLPQVRDRAQRDNYARLTADELIERGMVYYDAMRNPLSEADFAAALAAPGQTDATRCVAAYHRADSWWKERNRTRAAPLFDEAIAACDKTDDLELRVRAAYQAGRSYAHLGEHRTALARYRLAETYHHSYADDARLRQAEEHRALGEEDEVTARLSTLPDDYPTGDMRAEATWRLAWRAYKAGDFEAAISWLKKQVEVVPIDTNWWGEGQAQYWMGRAYGRLGKPAEAAAAYASCVREYPLSYYSLLALNRLREEHRPAFAALVAEIGRVPEGAAADRSAFEFAPRAVYGEVGFLRAVELLRLGLGAEADAELARVGLQVPPDRAEVKDADTIDRLWAVAFLYDRAGAYDKSHWPTRWHILDYKRRWPVGAQAARWRIAYPLAWWHLIAAAAREHGYPGALQIAIVREESAFDPIRESYANAIGLTQMIFPTARRFGAGTGIDITRENLRDPQKNVIIGSRFLAFLHQIFEGRVGLMIPSYNAGEGRIWQWMWQYQGLAQDEWAEEIPGDQARNYSKRVIASYFAYAYLDGGVIPEMPNDLPLRLIPERKVRQWQRRPP
jgi:soluble lytic murein transglycosylase